MTPDTLHTNLAPIQRERLFFASCLGLIATSMSFAVMADIRSRVHQWCSTLGLCDIDSDIRPVR